jgi:hypothetical protein
LEEGRGDRMSQLKFHREKKLKLTDEEKQTILDEICNDLQEAINSDPDLQDRIDGYDKLYSGDLPEKTEPWAGCSNLNHPMVRINVARAVARFMKAIFGRGKIMVARPGMEKQQQIVPRIETTIDFIMRTVIKIERTVRRLLKKVSKHGTAIAHPYWYEEKQIVSDVKVYNGTKDLEKFKEDFPTAKEGGMTPEEYRGYVKDLEEDESIEVPIEYEDYKFRGVKVDLIDRRDFIIHKDVIELEDAKVMGQRLWQGWYDIAGRYDNGEYGEESGGQSLESLIDKLGGEEKKTDEDKEPEYKKQRLECVKGIYKYDVDKCGKREEELLISLVKDEKTGVKHLLRCQYYGFWHGRKFFIPFRIDESDTFDGEGFTEKLWDLNLYANAAHNQGVDRGILMNTPFFKGQKGATGIEESRLELGKGIIYWLDNPDSFEQVAMQGAPLADVMTQEQMYERLAELTTGIPYYASGKESPTDPRAPAAKVAMLLQQQDIGVGDYIDSLDTGFSELAYQILGLYYEFGFKGDEEPVFMRELVGEKYHFQPLSREELKSKGIEFELRCSNAGMNDLVEEAKWGEAMQLLMREPLIAQDENRRLKLEKEYLTKMGLTISSEILPDPAQLKKDRLKMIREGVRKMIKEKFGGQPQEQQSLEMLKQLGLGEEEGGGELPPEMGGGLLGEEVTPEAGL